MAGLFYNKKLFIYEKQEQMKYFKITFSSKIDKITGNLVNGAGSSGSTCANGVNSLSIPDTLSSVSDSIIYECANIQSVTVGKQTYRRPEGSFEIPIRLNNKTIVEKIKEQEECTVLPFVLKMPLCPEE